MTVKGMDSFVVAVVEYDNDEGGFIIIDIIFITKIAMSDNNSLSQLLSWVNN